MRVQTFALCDAAVVRMNMLTTVNAGINSMPRSTFPAQMQCDLAIALELDLVDGRFDLNASLHVVDEAREDFEFPPLDLSAQIEGTDEGGDSESDSVVFAQAISLQDLTLPLGGRYRLELRSGDELVTFLRFHMQLLG